MIAPANKSPCRSHGYRHSQIRLRLPARAVCICLRPQPAVLVCMISSESYSTISQVLCDDARAGVQLVTDACQSRRLLPARVQQGPRGVVRSQVQFVRQVKQRISSVETGMLQSFQHARNALLGNIRSRRFRSLHTEGVALHHRVGGQNHVRHVWVHFNHRPPQYAYCHDEQLLPVHIGRKVQTRMEY